VLTIVIEIVSILAPTLTCVTYAAAFWEGPQSVVQVTSQLDSYNFVSR